MVPGSCWCIKGREKSPESLLVEWHMFLPSLELSPSPEWPWRSPQPSVTLEVPNSHGNRLFETPRDAIPPQEPQASQMLVKEKLTGIFWWKQAIPITANHWEGIWAITSSQDGIHVQMGCKLFPLLSSSSDGEVPITHLCAWETLPASGHSPAAHPCSLAPSQLFQQHVPDYLLSLNAAEKKLLFLNTK